MASCCTILEMSKMDVKDYVHLEKILPRKFELELYSQETTINKTILPRKKESLRCNPYNGSSYFLSRTIITINRARGAAEIPYSTLLIRKCPNCSEVKPPLR
ncbi:hypothetical protein RRG08_001647 [Elysia crispata]|uniref:Uncharacterized protein n=1 Tax=Elysia crispata TaxID=231223 RepID=A0AAE1E085_9GAST|nr:hypothetical protein RRG08_001647 [Elysia crispata]